MSNHEGRIDDFPSPPSSGDENSLDHRYSLTPSSIQSNKSPKCCLHVSNEGHFFPMVSTCAGTTTGFLFAKLTGVTPYRLPNKIRHRDFPIVWVYHLAHERLTPLQLMWQGKPSPLQPSSAHKWCHATNICLSICYCNQDLHQW